MLIGIESTCGENEASATRQTNPPRSSPRSPADAGDTAMKTIKQSRNPVRRAFALADLLVLVAALALMAFLIYENARTKDSHGADRLRCVNRLRQVGQAFRLWADDHDGKYPFFTPNVVESYTGTLLSQNLTNAQAWMHFQVMSNELGDATSLSCPSDRVRRMNAAEDYLNGSLSLSAASRRNLSVSYFVGVFSDETKPRMILAGDRSISPSTDLPGYSSLGMGAVSVRAGSDWSVEMPGELHRQGGNVALADGSVQQLNSNQLKEMLKKAEITYGTNVNMFLFPQ